ncbi:MAG: SAM-dependent methyltransferase [Planctomycetota bacterium]|nr:SAM-dependent methyltransferase [Planctomycetota bacterium]
MSERDTQSFVSRGGLKLAHALNALQLDPRGLVCADLGCSTGGFTDCLLKAGAAKVHAVDTAYGQLAWPLRKDPRVVVMERSNALHVSPPELVDLVVIDLSWTPQRLCIPAALAWLKPGGRIITLVKPHYELKSIADAGGPQIELPRGGVLDPVVAQNVTQRVLSLMPQYGARVLDMTESPILGGKAAGKGGGKSVGRAAGEPSGAGSPAIGTGNKEWLALLERA